MTTSSNDDRTIPHQKVLAVVSVETGEVEVSVGPRRIDGLIFGLRTRKALDPHESASSIHP